MRRAPRTAAGRVVMLLSAWMFSSIWFGGSALRAAPSPPGKGNARLLPLKPSPHRVRIRIDRATLDARLRGLDLRVYEDRDGRPKPLKLKTGPYDLVRLKFRCSQGVIQMESPLTGETASLRSPATIKTPAGFLNYNGRPYREEIQVHAKGRFCQIVNVVDLEKYLEGLVNAEFSARWNAEAVDAQVIAARSYAVYQMGEARRRKKPWDMESTISDQVYDGPMSEDRFAARAVRRTRGQVLFPKKQGEKKPLKAFYHSTCGGATELPQNVWGRRSEGFFRKVKCPYCYRSPRYQWRIQYSDLELRHLIRDAVGRRGVPSGWPKEWKKVINQGRLQTIRPVKKDPHGRTHRVHTYWQLPGEKKLRRLSVKTTVFRGWLDVARFRSTAFSVTTRTGRGGRVKFLFLGRGNGHGVGMCQWGAKTMGEKGFKMAKILQFYYPDARIRKLW